MRHFVGRFIRFWEVWTLFLLDPFIWFCLLILQSQCILVIGLWKAFCHCKGIKRYMNQDTRFPAFFPLLATWWLSLVSPLVQRWTVWSLTCRLSLPLDKLFLDALMLYCCCVISLAVFFSLAVSVGLVGHSLYQSIPVYDSCSKVCRCWPFVFLPNNCCSLSEALWMISPGH